MRDYFSIYTVGRTGIPISFISLEVAEAARTVSKKVHKSAFLTEETIKKLKDIQAWLDAENPGLRHSESDGLTVAVWRLHKQLKEKAQEPPKTAK